MKSRWILLSLVTVSATVVLVTPRAHSLGAAQVVPIVRVQSTSPGITQTGNTNISGTGLFGSLGVGVAIPTGKVEAVAGPGSLAGNFIAGSATGLRANFLPFALVGDSNSEGGLAGFSSAAGNCGVLGVCSMASSAGTCGYSYDPTSPGAIGSNFSNDPNAIAAEFGHFGGNTLVDKNLGIGTSTPAVRLDVLGASGPVAQVISGAPSGIGYVGTIMGDSNTTNGIAGKSSAAGECGVIGVESGAGAAGVCAYSTNASGYGIYGNNTGGGYSGYFDQGNVYIGSRLGIGTTGPAFRFDLRDGSLTTGIFSGMNGGTPAYTHPGGSFYAGGTESVGGNGVIGASNASFGDGVIGIAGPSGTGVYGSQGGGNFAGDFAGAVRVQGSLSKASGSFEIDHPLDPTNKYLYHSFVESPDMKNIYDGTVVTDSNGIATITMPDWFEALNQDFRYQITVLGTDETSDWVMARVIHKMKGNQFTLQTSKPNIEVSWQVTGTRHDAWANAHRIQVEVDKKGDERGHLLHPKEAGYPDSYAMPHQPVGQRLQPTLHPHP